MTFQIPEELHRFSVSGLNDLLKQAGDEYATLKESLSPDTVTDEELDHFEELQQFVLRDGPAEIKSRKSRRDRFQNVLSAENGEEEEKEEEGEAEPEGDEKPEGDNGNEKEAVTAGMTTTVGTHGTLEVKLTDIIPKAPAPNVPASPRPRYSSLVAAAGVPDYEAGHQFDGLLEVAKAFESRSASFSRQADRGAAATAGEVHYPVALLLRNYPDEFSVNGDQNDYATLLKVSDESRLPGGSLLSAVEQRRKEIEVEHPEKDSLVAAQGWCAPSETDYDVCLQITTDGILDAPEVQARRGGIRHNTGIEFDSIFGCPTATGFFDLTEAQVAAGSPTKTCLEIPCPSFVDSRLGVTGLCLTGNILAIRGYPEFTATFVRGALAASAHQINREQIADMVADSTSVTLTGAAPWATDNSVVSQVLSAVELAVTDIKYRLRLQRSATLEVIFPYWILAQMRADWVRRNGTGSGPEALTLADSAISAALSARGARAQYVYDWQDAFATCAATGVGGDTPITGLPLSLQFLVYPAGTWVRAVSDVITLNSVYDSTKLATNQVTHLFTETGWAMVRMCPVSRVYTVNVCANGKTGLQRDVTC
jgi:hypothetical protein